MIDGRLLRVLGKRLFAGSRYFRNESLLGFQCSLLNKLSVIFDSPLLKYLGLGLIEGKGLEVQNNNGMLFAWKKGEADLRNKK